MSHIVRLHCVRSAGYDARLRGIGGASKTCQCTPINHNRYDETGTNLTTSTKLFLVATCSHQNGILSVPDMIRSRHACKQLHHSTAGIQRFLYKYNGGSIHREACPRRLANASNTIPRNTIYQALSIHHSTSHYIVPNHATTYLDIMRACCAILAYAALQQKKTLTTWHPT